MPAEPLTEEEIAKWRRACERRSKHFPESSAIDNGDEILRLIGALDALRAEVREWCCARCRAVYPGPPQPGVRCVICPRCSGPTMPLGRLQLAELEEQRDAAEARSLRHERERNRAQVRAEQLEAALREAVIQLGRIAELHRPVPAQESGGLWFCPLCSEKSVSHVQNVHCAPTIAQDVLAWMAKAGALDGIDVPAARRALGLDNTGGTDA